MAERTGVQQRWVLIDPKTPLPCALGVVAPEHRVNEIGALEREARERQFVVRAVLSDHVPLAGPMAEILTRPSYHLMSVNNNLLTIFLHHGGMNAAFFDLVGSGPDGALAYSAIAAIVIRSF